MALYNDAGDGRPMETAAGGQCKSPAGSGFGGRTIKNIKSTDGITHERSCV
jgi:hypothetical protein